MNLELIRVCNDVMREHRDTDEPLAVIIWRYARRTGFSKTEIAQALQQRGMRKRRRERAG